MSMVVTSTAPATSSMVHLMQPTTCQISTFGNFSPPAFDSVACAACFYFIYMLTPPYNQNHLYLSKICENGVGVLVCPQGSDPDECHCDNPRFVFNVPEFALNRSAIRPLAGLALNPPLPQQFDLVTRDCCQAAKQCCRRTLLVDVDTPEGAERWARRTTSKCKATWDGWNCFDDAPTSPANVSVDCPPYIYGFYHHADDSKSAMKTCTTSGWLQHNEREYTNYSGCTINQDVQVRLIAGIITFSISVVVVLPAVLLLSFLRRIRKQPMFVLHRHLLISFLLYGTVHLINVWLFVVDSAPLSTFIYTNHIFCRLLFSLQLRFLRLTNFSWMLAEGVYLYRLLHSAQQEGESLLLYKLICWGVPALITVFYMFVRGLYDEIGMCWVENSSVAWVEWCIILPSLLAIAVNVLLLTLVMFILVKKLRGDPHLERIQYRKAVRGALMLTPVFGMQQLLTIYRTSNTVYQAIDQSLNGLQGLFVALIVCYTNRNVLESADKWWHSKKESRALGTECRQRLSVQEQSNKLLLRPGNNNNILNDDHNPNNPGSNNNNYANSHSNSSSKKISVGSRAGPLADL